MAIFHFEANTGTRSGGQSARAKHDYIAREGSQHEHRDPRLHVESGHMPAFAAADAALYWQAADDHERANGRLYKHIEIALHRELTFEQNVELMQGFARKLTTGIDGGNLPHTFTIHAGGAASTAHEDLAKSNIHADLMISERLNDAIDRGPELWFARAATGKKTAAEGGAKKTDALKPTEWLENARKLWADMSNEALAKYGHAARIDHRTLVAQREEALAMGDHDRAKQLDREPGQHLGAKAHGYERRTGLKSSRRKHIEARQRERRAVKARASQLDHSIERTQQEISEGQRIKEAMARRIAAENLAAGKPSNTPAKAAARPVGASKPQAGTLTPGQTSARPKAPPKVGGRRKGPSLIQRKGMAKWAQDALDLIEGVAEAMDQWLSNMERMFREAKARAQPKPAIKATKPAAARTAKPVAPAAPRPAAQLQAKLAAQPAKAIEPAPTPGRSKVEDPRDVRKNDPREALEEKRRADAERRVRIALSKGAKGGVSPTAALADAAKLGDAESVERLIVDKGADPAANGGKALAEAGKKSPEMVKAMVQSMVTTGVIKDHADLASLASQIGGGPEAAAQIRQFAAEAKAGAGLSSAGFNEPKSPDSGPKKPGMSSGPSMGGGPSGGGGGR